VTEASPETGGPTYRLTEEQLMLRDAVRVLADELIAPRAAEIDRTAAFPWDVKELLASHDILGLPFPEEYGGVGGELLTLCLAIEAISRVCASSGLILAVQELGALPLLLAGTDDQKRRWFPDLAAGRKLIAFALTEAEAGSDAAAIRTRAVRDGDAYVIDGAKRFISQGDVADLVTVFAVTDPDAARHRNLSCFIVEKGTPGFSVGKLEHKLGIRGSDTAQLVFQDCRVPAANLLGEVGEGFKIALSTLDGGRISIAAQAVGIARACLEDSLAYAKEREAFGKKIVEFQAIQWKLADMATEIDAARLLVWRAATLKDRDEDHILAAAQAKLFASDVAVRAARECVQIFGGYGYLTDFPAERHYRDAKITEIYEGTSEIMNLVIAQEILK
jgi:alkylation response protein AidB-like acyl-CoA dehydrogenase